MKTMLLAAAAVMALSGPAFAVDPSPEAIANSYKAGKALRVDDVAALMRQAEIWCYKEDYGSCDWSEIYLSAESGAEGVVYDSSNAWSQDIEVSFVDKAQFEGNLLCEYGYDKIPSIRAVNRLDGMSLGGRALEALRLDIEAIQDGGVTNCFDYIYLDFDGASQTIALTQRQYVDGVIDPALEADVVIHFNADALAGLTLRLE